MDLKQDYFKLLGVAASYNLDLNKVSSNALILQKKFHPDKFVNSSSQEKFLALQLSSQINDAIRVLNDPVLRAEYLLKINNCNKDLDTDSMADTEFLMIQMELREQLEQTNSVESLEKFISDLEVKLADLSDEFSAVYQESSDKAFALLQKMKFFQRLSEQAENQLDDVF